MRIAQPYGLDDSARRAPPKGRNPTRRSPRSAMKTVFIGVLGCRCTPIRAETTPLEQVRLAVRLAVHAAPRGIRRTDEGLFRKWVREASNNPNRLNADVSKTANRGNQIIRRGEPTPFGSLTIPLRRSRVTRYRSMNHGSGQGWTDLVSRPSNSWNNWQASSQGGCHATRTQTGAAYAHRRPTGSAPGDSQLGHPALRPGPAGPHHPRQRRRLDQRRRCAARRRHTTNRRQVATALPSGRYRGPARRTPTRSAPDL